MNKNILSKTAITVLAGITTIAIAQSKAYQEANNSHLIADSDPISCEIEYVNVAFANGPYLLYAVKVENTEELPSMYVWTTGDGVYDLEDAVELSIYQKNVQINDEYYTTFIYDQISAKQMTDYIYARAYVDETSSDLLRYSVLEYAKQIIDTSENSDSLVILLQDMLTYGASSQIHFNYNVNRLPTDEFHKLDLENCVLDDGFNYGIFTQKEQVKLSSLDGNDVYWTLFNNNTYIRGEYSSTYTVTNLNKDLKVIAHESPVLFSLNYGDGISVTKNGNPYTKNYISVGENMSNYSINNNQLTIGDDVYTFTTNLEFKKDLLTVSEMSTDSTFYNVSYKLLFTYKDILSEISNDLDKDKTNMFLCSYQRLKTKISNTMYYYDDDNDEMLLRIINETIEEIDNEKEEYKSYVDEIDKIQAYVEQTYTEGSDEYEDYMSRIYNTRILVYEAEEKNQADGYIKDCQDYIRFYV